MAKTAATHAIVAQLAGGAVAAAAPPATATKAPIADGGVGGIDDAAGPGAQTTYTDKATLRLLHQAHLVHDDPDYGTRSRPHTGWSLSSACSCGLCFAICFGSYKLYASLF